MDRFTSIQDQTDPRLVLQILSDTFQHQKPGRRERKCENRLGADFRPSVCVNWRAVESSNLVA